MRIKKIELHNFGSYGDKCIFEFADIDPEKRVAIIGGKNGAGKTTLFSAIQVCLYGNYAFGYKTAGKRYLSDIYNLINNQVRIDVTESSFVEIQFEQVDNTDLFDYTIRRSWKWPQNELKEELTVTQNGRQLEEDDLLNFQNYLIHLIPPEMLKLYFFDGEKIADYFLSDKEINIRDALMVLSGNDTFDILHDQVRRVVKASGSSNDDAASAYLTAQAEFEKVSARIISISGELEDLRETSEDLESEIARNKKSYAEHGGITIEEWTALHNQLKEEEERRERLNWQRKSYATDSLPFVILPHLVSRVLPQLQSEKEYQTYGVLKETLEQPGLLSIIESAVKELGSKAAEHDATGLLKDIQGYLLDEGWESYVPLFGLSSDEEGQVHSVLNRVNSFERDTFAKYQRRINASLEKSKTIRAKIQSSSLEHFEEYTATVSSLEEELQAAKLRSEHLQEALAFAQSEFEKQSTIVKNLKKQFEDTLKVQSVSAVSGKVLLLLEDLQKKLYADLIQAVERDVNLKFEQLIRKKNFFSRIYIDTDFNVHILRVESVSRSDILGLLRTGGVSAIKNALGDVALEKLQAQCDATTAGELRKAIEDLTDDKLSLPVELNKDRLSSGEKQIFVMALYWSMMQQSKNDLPFIIDTPFARIDTQHRANITEHFFRRLTGQLLILSTDEELSSKHLAAMKDQISRVYTLEYGDDKRTYIHSGQYFEV